MNLAITAKTKERLLRVQQLAEADTLSEAIRRSLAVYETLLEHKEKEGQVVLRAKDGTDEAILALVP